MRRLFVPCLVGSLVIFAFVCSLCCTPAAAAADQTHVCKQGHRGILFHIRNKNDISKGCKVTAVLKRNCLKLLRGNKEYKTIDLEAIETPLHLLPNDETCISIKHAREEPDILCCENRSCRDQWWKTITKQILCLHQGPMRNEVAGEPPLEIEQREVLEKVVEKPEKGGITIHIDKGQMPAEPILSIHPKFRGVPRKRHHQISPF